MIISLSPAWFCIGVGRLTLLGYEVLPRLAATIIVFPLLLWTNAIWVYGALIVLTTPISLMWFYRHENRGAYTKPGWLPSLKTLGRQSPLALTSFPGVAYAALPLPITQVTISAGLTAKVASADAATLFLGNLLIPSGKQQMIRIAVASSAVMGISLMIYFGIKKWPAGIPSGLAI